jgi:SAM-dependent methyltransferase
MAEHFHDRCARLAADRPVETEPGDASLVGRCHGPTLDVGSERGRLTVALAERGIPALGIDVTPFAVRIARASGALAIIRDVFDRVPGTGRWQTVLVADGNIGIGGDPAALLERIGDLLAPQGHALVEVEAPGAFPSPAGEGKAETGAGPADDRSSWVRVGADQIGDMARGAGLVLRETWTESGRWFARLGCAEVAESIPIG